MSRAVCAKTDSVIGGLVAESRPRRTRLGGMQGRIGSSINSRVEEPKRDHSVLTDDLRVCLLLMKTKINVTTLSSFFFFSSKHFYGKFISSFLFFSKPTQKDD